MAPAILGLIQLAPTLMRFFGAGEKSATVVEKVSEIANTVAGTSSTEEALSIISSNSDKLYEFRKMVMDNDTELEKLYLADLADARKRDSEFIKAGARNYRADGMYVLAVLVIAVLVHQVLSSELLDEYAKGIVTLVLGRFLGYLDGIYNFEFGSTRSSKMKDDTINKLMER